MSDEKKGQRVDERYFLNFENIRRNIVYRLINTERNRELLEDIPHIEFMDLSIIFRCILTEKELSSSSLLIYNMHLKLWDVTVEELYQIAGENTKKMEGYEIKTMTEVVQDIVKEEKPDEYDYDECMKEFLESVPMYVLSNKNRIEGAACILYTNLIREFADEINSSFYIIPSSVHECLLLPFENLDESSEVKSMIKEINDKQVKPEEILSYSLYCYDKEEGKIYKC